MMYFSLPATLLALQIPLLFGIGLVQAADPSPTLIPPSSFPSGSGSTTSGHVSGTSTHSGSSSANSSTSASSTTSALFPSLSGVSSCVTNCFETSISSSNCTSVVDVNCFCVSGKFPPAIVSCISKTCSDQLNTAEQLSQQFCNLANTSTSLSFPTPSSTRSSSSSSSSSSVTAPTASSTTATPSATQTGAAKALGYGSEVAGAMWIGIGGALMGAIGVLFV